MKRATIVLAMFITTILCSTCVSVVLAEEPIELVSNGGFETGDFSGWQADSNCQMARSAYSEPSHSGYYCARVGTDSSSGTLSQTCRIPGKSAATLSFWYRVEKGCSLEAKLTKSRDGSVIKSWSLKGDSWKSIKLDLDLSLANQQVTIELTGTGYAEEHVYSMLTSRGIMYFSSYTYYYAYVDDFSLAPRVAGYEVTVTVSSLPRDLSSKVFVDGTVRDRTRVEQAVICTFGLQESHVIEVEQSVDGGNGVRYYCASNIASVSSDSTCRFVYVKQYFLKVESVFGSCLGEGWQNAGENANFSVSPQSLSMSGLQGSLGFKYVFDRWSGDSSTASTQGTILMDGPKRVTAIWREDYSLPIIVFSVLAIVGGYSGFRLAKRRKVAGLKQVFKVGPPAKEEAKLKPEQLDKEAPEVKMEDKADRERYLKRLDELKAQKKISDSVYERLKKEYQTEKT